MARPKPTVDPNKKIRVQLDMLRQEIEDIDLMGKKMLLPTRRDIFDNSLALLRLVIEEIEAGRMVASVDSENKIHNRFLMPGLEAVRRQAKKKVSS